MNLSGEEKITAILPVRAFEEGKYVLMATKQGVIKKTDLMSYSHPRTGGIIALTLDPGGRTDLRLPDRRHQGDSAEHAGREGHSLYGRRCPGHGAHGPGRERDHPGEGRFSGVHGHHLPGNHGASILSVTENGFGKRTLIEEYPPAEPGRKGVITDQDHAPATEKWSASSRSPNRMM